jgi:hypothetical protein
MKKTLKKIPIIGTLARRIHRSIFKLTSVRSSEEYWIRRYRARGNSGAGSYHELAEFKAEVINDFVKNNSIHTVIEFGSGDGNQLRLAEYPSYIGFDVSPDAIALCQNIFRDDKTKRFKLMRDYKGETAQLALSLDVIFHLIEDDVYSLYMERLFASSERFVIIYSTNYEAPQNHHERHRHFSKWIEDNDPSWKLVRQIPNKYPYKSDNEKGSFCDFFIYEKA